MYKFSIVFLASRSYAVYLHLSERLYLLCGVTGVRDETFTDAIGSVKTFPPEMCMTVVSLDTVKDHIDPAFAKFLEVQEDIARELTSGHRIDEVWIKNSTDSLSEHGVSLIVKGIRVLDAYEDRGETTCVRFRRFDKERVLKDLTRCGIPYFKTRLEAVS